MKKRGGVICVSRQRLFSHDNLANITKVGPDHGRHNTAPTLSLTVFSPFIGNLGYSKPIAKIAKHQRVIGNLGNCKRIANLANGLSAVWSGTRSTTHQARAARHGSLCQSDRSIVLFARSFLLSAFCWQSPPPRADGLVGQGRWVHKKFFLFLIVQQPNSPTAH